jgi:hypothetical protein
MRRWAAFAASLTAIVLLLFLSSHSAGLQDPGAARWPSILPPVIAVLLSVCFRRVVFAMTSALVVGAFLAYGPAPSVALPEGFRKLIWENLSSEFNLYILAFTFSLMGMVQVMRRSGAIQGLMEVILKAPGARDRHASSRPSWGWRSSSTTMRARSSSARPCGPRRTGAASRGRSWPI